MIVADARRAGPPPPSAGEGTPRSGGGEGSDGSGGGARQVDGPTADERRLNPVTPRLRALARGQRGMMTAAEAAFWQQVRGGRFRGLKFRRQAPVAPYVVDFLCASARLVVELDGAPHETEARRQRDARRDAWLRAQGFEVVRFPNDLILTDLGRVLDRVGAAVDARSPRDPSGAVAPLSRPGLTAGPPSPAGGGGKARTPC